MNGAPWLYEGDEAVVFLEAVDSDAAAYTFVSSQGQVMLRRGSKHPPPESDARHHESDTAGERPHETALEKRTPKEAIAEIRRAIDEAHGRDYRGENIRAADADARSRWSGEPTEVRSVQGADGLTYRLRGVAATDGFCFVLSPDPEAAPTTCVTASSIEERVQGASGALWGVDESAGIVYGVTAAREVRVAQADGESRQYLSFQPDGFPDHLRLFLEPIDDMATNPIETVEGVR